MFKKKKLVIEVIKRYDEHNSTEHIHLKEQEFETVIKDIQDRPHIYISSTMDKDKLQRRPHMRFSLGDYGTNKGNLIKARLNYSCFAPIKKEKKPNNFAALFFFAVIAIGATTVWSISLFLDNMEAQIARENTCYVYTKAGVAYKFQQFKTVYKYDKEGHIPLQDQPFINPWYRAQVDDPFTFCKRIELEKESSK